MKKVAVLLTVNNRKETTLKGLRSLYESIAAVGDGYSFDVYMTDDGSTDGTSEAVAKEFPEVKIIKGDGSLYWSGGMRKAWQTAIGSGIIYDCYLWFNDDAELYEYALQSMFNSLREAGGNSIISGAFCDEKGNVAYGGRDKNKRLVAPCGEIAPIYLTNGNLVIIPKEVYCGIGMIDKVFKHGAGDWDYGLRAIKAGYGLYLTSKYVGMTNRHDETMSEFANKNYSLPKRIKKLYSNKHNPFCDFVFFYRHYGAIHASRSIILKHLYTFFPSLIGRNNKSSVF